jgi:23S rRNA (cytosine1962-C5)-methyltransferase
MEMNLTTLLGNIPADGSCARIFHGRGNLTLGHEHLVIDYYPPNLFITIYKEKDIQPLDEMIILLQDFPVENILLQKRYLARPEIIALKGSVPQNAIAFEAGSNFHVKFGSSQNIGFFLDMASGRDWLLHNSKDKRVLNLFSYTCSLSVAALKGEAESVVNVDMSKAALGVGQENHTLNGLDLKKAKFLSYDIMNSWNNIAKGGPYDIVIIDPPTNQGDSFKVDRDYYKIVKRLKAMTSKDAAVMACLNSPYLNSEFLVNLFKEHAPEFLFQESIKSSFYSMEKNPEEGLKILLFKKLA